VARLIATGTAPKEECLATAGKVFDVPAFAEAYDTLLARGWAVPYPEGTDPGVDVVQVANAMVRGDSLLTPAEQAIAAAIGRSAHEIVAAQASTLEVVSAAPVQTTSDSPELDRGAQDMALGVGAVPEVGESLPMVSEAEVEDDKPAAAAKPRASRSRKKA